MGLRVTTRVKQEIVTKLRIIVRIKQGIAIELAIAI